jgi:hypothetical protein
VLDVKISTKSIRMKRYSQKHKANSAKYDKLKKKDREENRQKERSKKKKD